LALGIAALLSFVLYAAWHRHELAAIWSQARVRYLALMTLPMVTGTWVQGRVLRETYGALGTVLRPGEAIALAVLTTAGNYTPAVRLGAVARAAYLKRAHGVALTDTIALSGGYTAVTLATSLACGFAVLVRLGAWRHPAGALSTAGLGAGCVLLVGGLLAPWLGMAPVLTRAARRLGGERLGRVVEVWELIGRPRLLLTLCWWNVVLLGLAVTVFHMAFTLLLGQRLSLEAALALAVSTSLSGLLAVTPGNLGVREFLIVAVSHSFDLGGDAGIVVAAAIRLVQFAVIMGLLPVVWRWMGGVRPSPVGSR
jgi:hypothetical protein